MFRKLSLALALITFSLGAWADETSLRKLIEVAYPKMNVESVTKTNHSGLYEVYMGGQIIYTDEKFTFLIAEGRMVDTRSKRDITSDRLADLSKIDFSSLPLDQAIKVVKGNGNKKIAVFSDPDCPFCKRLEQNELSAINDVTIYTFLLPLDQLHPDAANKAKAIWCSADKSKAWNDWVFNGQLPKKINNCDTPLEKNSALAKKLSVASTPTLFFVDGKRMLGAYPAAEIEKALLPSKK